MRSLRVLSIIGIILYIATVSVAAAPEKDAYIYKGDGLSESGITVGSWGSGKALEVKEKVLTGNYSIKLITQNLYSGGRLDFAEPVTLFTGGVDKTRYMIFALFFSETQTINPAAGAIDAFDIEPYVTPKSNKIRLVLVSDKGVKISIEEPTNPVDPDDGWVRIAVPLEKLKAAGAGDEFKLKRMLMFSDTPSNIYIGEIKLANDTALIKVESLDSQVTAQYYEVLLVAKAESGISSLKYSWDYDSSNGIQADSTGLVGRYIYTKSGEFTVTLTVSDVDGIKAPVQVTSNISVND